MFVSKAKLMMAVLVVALVVPATAFAAHSWPDVPDDKFYTESVAWAKANGMTTGCDGGTNFCPERGVTRGENITYAKRYDDIVAQPAFLTLGAAADAAQADADANAAAIADKAASADVYTQAEVDAIVAPLFGLIDEDGIIVNGSSSLESSVRNGLGSYTLTFDRNISACVSVSSDNIFNGTKDVSSDVAYGSNYGRPKDLDVRVTDETGASADTYFNVIVMCEPPAVGVLGGSGAPADSPNG